MHLASFVAAALLQPSWASFSQPFQIADPIRLALTPRLDGILDSEEWDPLHETDALQSYFQWEPGALHFAGAYPPGQEVLISLDLNGDGWLSGNDNLEVRVRYSDSEGTGKLDVRRLDARGGSGPVWEALPGFAKASSIKAFDGGFEMTLLDPGYLLLPVEPGRKIGLRVDAFPAGSQPPAYLPRLMETVELRSERAAGLPSGLQWGVERNLSRRQAIAGRNLDLRLTFRREGEIGLSGIEVRSEGFLERATQNAKVSFPPFDGKGRAIYDYKTPIPEGARTGYRLLRASVEAEDGGAGIIQASYRVAPLLEFDLVPIRLKASPQERVERLSYYLQSNTQHRLDGTVKLYGAGNAQVQSGSNKGFVIYNAFGRQRRVFELKIPAGFQGSMPIRFQGILGGLVIEQDGWLTVE